MGDVQYLDYEVFSDFHQFIVRAGLSYNFKGTPLKILAGHSYFTSGFSDENNDTFYEHRPCQDIIWNKKLLPGFTFYSVYTLRVGLSKIRTLECV